MYYRDIVGQFEIKKMLIDSIKNEKISHCYIFDGPKGIGKYQLSLVFAQSLFCDNLSDEPCNVCLHCKKVNSFNHADIHIINKQEEKIKKEDIDDLVNSIYLKPYESNKKVYIINNAENITVQAANALLKTLEEPPKDSIIILISNNINYMLPTILSRCQIIKFKSINFEQIKEYLIKEYSIDEEKSHISSFYSKGILNKAVNIALGNDNILEKRKEVINILDKIIASDSSIIYDLESYFDKERDNIDSIIEIMMVWVRDVLFFKNNTSNLIINKDMEHILSDHSRLLCEDNNLIEYLQWVSESIKNNVNYKLIIDKMILEIQRVFKNDKSCWS